MKNLAYLLLLFCAPALAQDWKPVKIDSVVSVQLPEGYTRKDTTNGKELSAQSMFGYLSVIITPDSVRQMPDIEKKKHLERYYDKYTKSLASSVKGGRISGELDTMLGNLHIKDFLLETNGPDGHLFRKFRLLHENCETYVFQYLYNAQQAEVAQDEQAKFFGSIKLANTPSLPSQFTAEVKTAKKKKGPAVWIALGVVGFCILSAFAARRRKNKPHK